MFLLKYWSVRIPLPLSWCGTCAATWTETAGPAETGERVVSVTKKNQANTMMYFRPKKWNTNDASWFEIWKVINKSNFIIKGGSWLRHQGWKNLCSIFWLQFSKFCGCNSLWGTGFLNGSYKVITCSPFISFLAVDIRKDIHNKIEDECLADLIFCRVIYFFMGKNYFSRLWKDNFTGELILRFG